MKVFVATTELRWKTLRRVPPRMKRGSLVTFTYVPDGEIVMPLVCWEVIGCNHNNAGCYRSLGGVDSHKGTTHFKVVERSIALEELEGKFLESLKQQGWIDSKMWQLPLHVWQAVAKSFARGILRAASKFPLNDIVSKRGCMFWSRKDPRRSAKIIIRPPSL